MKAISDLIISKNTLKGVYFRVHESIKLIDLTELETMFVPIGNESYKFEGYFDGSYARFNLDISRNIYYQGLFGYIGLNGVVKKFIS